ncbi:MAG TPA: type IV secretion system DNA-binding domain-containing protein, partial [Planctomycetota bacterium]|nr:type IV secretion system DNA-binding domain-containing protein [Planctomycetota bacterium]
MTRLALSAAMLASAAGAVALADDIPHGRALAGASTILGMASVIPIASWMRDRRRRLGLRGRGPLPIDGLPTRPGRVYLGRGFEWTPLQAIDLEREAARGAGSNALHAVGVADERDLHLVESELDLHMLILGSTGTGKTRLLEVLIAQAIRRREAVAVIDPKGDAGLLARVVDECRRAGKPLALIAPPYPAASMRYNPVAQFVEPREIADRIAALLPAGGDAEPFRAFAWEVIETVATAMVRHGEKATLAAIRAYAVEDLWTLPRKLVLGIAPELAKLDSETIAKRFLARKDRPATPELDRLLSLALRPREHAQKLSSALIPILSKLTSGSHRDLLSPETGGFSWGELDRTRGVAYFFLGSLLGADSAGAVAKLALLDFQSYVGAKFAYGLPGGPISLFVDELADAVSTPFISLLNKGRGAGLRIAGSAQSAADFESALGSEARARQVLANVNTVVQFRSPSLDDAAAFSSLAGARLLPAVSDAESYEPALFRSGLDIVDDFRAVFGKHTAWRSSEFVPPWAVTSLPRFECFVRSGARVAKGVAPLMAPAPGDPVRSIQEGSVDAADVDFADGAGGRGARLGRG